MYCIIGQDFEHLQMWFDLVLHLWIVSPISKILPQLHMRTSMSSAYYLGNELRIFLLILLSLIVPKHFPKKVIKVFV